MKCPKCGNEFAEGIFCPECGTRIELELSTEEQEKIIAEKAEVERAAKKEKAIIEAERKVEEEKARELELQKQKTEQERLAKEKADKEVELARLQLEQDKLAKEKAEWKAKEDAAAHAIADLVTPDKLNVNYIMPNALDVSTSINVTVAVAKTVIDNKLTNKKNINLNKLRENIHSLFIDEELGDVDN